MKKYYYLLFIIILSCSKKEKDSVTPTVTSNVGKLDVNFIVEDRIAWDFGGFRIGEQSAITYFELRNSGTKALTINQVELSKNFTCPLKLPIVLKPDEFILSIPIAFNPVSVGNINEKFKFKGDFPEVKNTLDLKGVGFNRKHIFNWNDDTYLENPVTVKSTSKTSDYHLIRYFNDLNYLNVEQTINQNISNSSKSPSLQFSIYYHARFSEIVETIKEIKRTNQTLDDYFSDDDKSFIIYDNATKYKSINTPQELDDKVNQVLKSGERILKIDFDFSDNWVLLGDKGTVAYSNKYNENSSLIQRLREKGVKSFRFWQNGVVVLKDKNDFYYTADIPAKFVEKMKELKSLNHIITNIDFSHYYREYWSILSTLE